MHLRAQPRWVKHIAAFTAIFTNICTAHAQKRLYMNFRCKFRHLRSIRRPRFPTKVQNFGHLATFSVEFCILYVECPPYFYFRFVWPTDLKSIPHALAHTTITSTKFEPLTPIRSWVMSDNVSHWLPLKMRTRPLRMRRITWPRFAYSLYNFHWATTTIKGRLLSSVTNAETLPCVNFLCVTLWPWPLTFWHWTVVIHGESRDQPRRLRVVYSRAVQC